MEQQFLRPHRTVQTTDERSNSHAWCRAWPTVGVPSHFSEGATCRSQVYVSLHGGNLTATWGQGQPAKAVSWPAQLKTVLLLIIVVAIVTRALVFEYIISAIIARLYHALLWRALLIQMSVCACVCVCLCNVKIKTTKRISKEISLIWSNLSSLKS